MATIPDKLNNMAAYNGADELMGIANITLPSIQYMTDTQSGAGIMGEIDMPTIGMTQSTEVSIEWNELTKAFSGLVGNRDGVSLEFRGAIDHVDEKLNRKVIVPVFVAIAGFTKSAELGTLTPGSKSSPSMTVECWRVKITIDGVVTTHINKYANIFVVNGEDIYSEVRAALGKM